MTHPPTGIACTLAARLNTGETVSTETAVGWLRVLAWQVADWHQGGHIHRSINPASIGLDENQAPRLAPSSTGQTLVVASADREFLPPEFGRMSVGQLPSEMTAAAEALAAAGVDLAPRQIDLYALGAVLCRLLTGRSAAEYLRSAKAKSEVPVGLRPAIERALRSDGREPFADAAEFATALDCDFYSTSADSTVDSGPYSRETPPSGINAADTSTWIKLNLTPPVVDGELPFQRLGHYQIVGRIGHGGMGDVYLGYESALDRQVAIKVLPTELARHAEFIRRFKAEATAAARLIHPNIIQIYFIGEDAGHHYFAMQYVAGESVADLLHRRGKLQIDEAFSIVEQALSGLAAAHHVGLVHRDIKPGNILLDRGRRRVLLADFGLVKSVTVSGAADTATGVVMGTVDYLSPEQGRGQPVDGRSDLYSFGVLFYQLLSGRLPFAGDSPTAVIFQHVYEQPPSLAEVLPRASPSLVALIAKLLRKSPSDRYQSVDELLSDLRACRTGQPLPSGADRLSVHDPGAKPHRPSVVWAPAPAAFQEPVELTGRDCQPLNFWERGILRAQSLFWRHAPDAVQRWQNTQQQIDGAIARYARQERELQSLADEASAVLLEFRRLALEHLQIAEQSRQQAAAATDTTSVHLLQGAEIAASQTASELERQAREQREQLDSIELKRAQAAAKRQQLAAQRNVLQARLKLAGAKISLEGISPRRSYVGLVVLVLGILTLLMATTFTGFMAEGTSRSRLGHSGSPRAITALNANPQPPISDSKRPTTAQRDINVVAPAELITGPAWRLAEWPQENGVRGLAYDRSTAALGVFGIGRFQYFDTKAQVQVEAVHMPESTRGLAHVAPSADGRYLVVGVVDPLDTGAIIVRRYDAKHGTLRHTSRINGTRLRGLLVAPDGRTVAAIHSTHNGPGRLHLWDVPDRSD